jgi:hypothetical protein
MSKLSGSRTVKKASDKSLGSASKSAARRPFQDYDLFLKGSSAIEQHIGCRLQAMYDEIVAEPIPDQLLDLLRRLDLKTGAK